MLGERGQGKNPDFDEKLDEDIDESSAQARSNSLSQTFSNEFILNCFNIVQFSVFSLFSIVTFQNQGCATNLGASGSG